MYLLLNSHLSRAPCDKFVYDFLCNFGGIVGGYGLRRMCSHCLRASCNFLYCPSEKLCNLSAVAVQSPQPPHGNRHGYGLTVSSNLYNFPLNKIVEVAEPMNPYEISQPPPASAQKGGCGQDTGTVSQAKCE